MKREISIYIHLPFCKSKCLYCDFLSFGGYEKYMYKYKEALIKEIEGFKADSSVKSIFIGGGTPSIVPKEYIAEILESIYKSFDILPQAEITIEANPATFDIEKLSLYKKVGINRLSMGLQAWQNELLISLGRAHSRQQFLEGYKNARAVGFDNINVDIMFALPKQSLENWQETINEVAGLKPEHISAYSLIIEEGTPFYEKWQRGEIAEVDESLDRQMYYYAVDTLNKNGYKQYEISNFAVKGRECRHNIVYWKRGEYIGFGLGAASLIKGARYTNTRDIEKYLVGERLGESERLSIADEMSEFMFLGLRMTEGIKRSDFFDTFKRDINDIFGEALNKHISDGLLIAEGDIIRLSKKGIDLSNMVFVDFI